MKRWMVLYALVGGCSSSPAERGPSPAQVYGPPPGRTEAVPRQELKELTLDGALALAEQAHPDLAAARARIEAADGRIHQAGLLPNPEFVARMESAPFKGGTTDQAEYPVGVSQRLAVGGRLGAAVRVEELERERLRRDLEVRRIEVRGRIHGAFAAALHLEEARKIQEDSLRIAENGAAVTRARQAAGDALPEEVARAEMEQIRVRLDLERIRSLRGQSAAALTAALGDSSLRIESVQGTLEMTLEIPTLETIQDSVGRHPAFGSAEADVAAQRARIELAEAQRIPDVTLDLFYRRLQHSEDNSFDVGVTIPLPVFDRNQGRLREARADTSAAEARLRSARNELLRELRQAHGRLASALGAARTLKDEILPRAETVLKGAETRYAAGDLSLPDLIPIRRDRGSLQLTYLESLREVMEAWSELKPFLETPVR